MKEEVSGVIYLFCPLNFLSCRNKHIVAILNMNFCDI